MSPEATRVTRALGVALPVVQAPMAGVATPALVAAVSRAGGLGSLGAALLAPDALRAAVAEVRRGTDRPFAVNLFAWPATPPAAAGAVAATLAALAPLHRELGLGAPCAPPAGPALHELLLDQLAVVAEERVPVCSIALGIPPLDALHATGAVLAGTATCVADAVALEAAGFDLVVAQGAEAGGHRGGGGADGGALVGTLALVPQVADAVGLGVIAAGGIMDGRGVAAALALGAGAAQLGTAFLACPESGAPAAHRAALAGLRDTATVVTDAPTGRHARVVGSRLVDAVTGPGPRPAFPAQAQLTGAAARAAAEQGRDDLGLLFAGQAAGIARALPAGELVRTLAAEARAVVAALA